MISNKGRYFIIILGIIILVYELIELDYHNFWTLKNISGLIAPILLIAAMIASIIHVNKHGEN